MWERGNKKPVKSNDIDDGGSPIPPETIEIVISNLPAKSLLRFQCISRSWRSMISEFSATPSRKSKESNLNNCIICNVGFYFNHSRPVYSLLKFKNGRLEHEESILNVGHSILSYSARCSYNGLVLLKANYVKEPCCILWNPSIQKWRKISCPVLDPGRHVGGHGICYDPVSGDLKIVILSHKKLLVYSCKSSTWSSKDNTIGLFTCSTGVSTECGVYWSAWGVLRSMNARVKHLLKFDSQDNQLHLIQMPECIERCRGTPFTLSTLRDTLYLWSVHLDGAESLMSLWVMKEDHSWMNLMNMTYRLPYYPWGIWFMNDGNDILLYMPDTPSVLYTCNLANKVFTRFGCHFNEVIPYVDCPFFPKMEEGQ